MALTDQEAHSREAAARRVVYGGDRAMIDDEDFRERISRNTRERESAAAAQKAARDKEIKDQQDALTKSKQLAITSQQAQTRGQLAEQIQGARAGANRRGLLYSGLNQAAQGGLRAGAQAQMAQGAADINAASQDQMAQMQQQEMANSMTRQQNQINMNRANFKMALDKRKRDQEQGAAIGSGIGGGLGTIASALTGGLL